MTSPSSPYLIALSDQVGAALRESGGGVSTARVCALVGCTPFSPRGLLVASILTGMTETGRLTREGGVDGFVWGAAIPTQR